MKKILICSLVILVSLLNAQHQIEKWKETYIGKVKPKNSLEIKNSPWGIQAGTLDKNILKRAGEIGVKWTRLNASWSEIEKEKGKYDWERTDEAFSAALQVGITPFVSIAGTNKFYVKTRTDLDPKLAEIYGTKRLPPTSNPEAFSAWLEFVSKLIDRYKEKIKYWEIWNEPNHFAYWGDEPNAKEYGRMVHETAKVIKKNDPTAIVLAGALAGLDHQFVDDFLSVGNKDIVDIVTFHNYGSIPEERIYLAVKVWEVIEKYNPSIKLWQGECGYPSHSSTRDFRGSSPWGPIIQAKWLLRQSFTDTYFCKTELSNYFILFNGNDRNEMPKRSFMSPIDSVLGFPERKGARVKVVGVNEKCLLENPSLKPKPGFFAYQNLCSIFDGNYKQVKVKHSVEINDCGTFYGIGKADDAFPSIPLLAAYKNSQGKYFIAYWLPWHPVELINEASISLSINGINFSNPVLVDLLNGKVYELSGYKKESKSISFSGIPLADYPFVIMERDQIELVK